MKSYFWEYLLYSAFQGQALKHGDEEYGNISWQRYAVRDSTGKTIMLIDTMYALADQAVAPPEGWTRIGYDVTIYFHEWMCDNDSEGEDNEDKN